MKTVLGSWRRTVIVAMGGLALAFAGWACKSSSEGNGGGASCAEGTGGGAAASPEAGMCDDPSAPAPPKTACDPCGDVYKQCPLPKSVTQDDGEYTTVYYYSDPTCRDGFCHYCVTSTMTEDPGVTGVP